ncbi:hypothetical protein ACNKHP_25360 [Shigella boydii]
MAWRDRDEVKQILEGVSVERSTGEGSFASTEALLGSGPGARAGYGEDNEEREEELRSKWYGI